MTRPPRDPEMQRLFEQLGRPMSDRAVAAGLRQLTAQITSPRYRRTMGSG
ncbi:MAG: hypothetical protein INF91_03325 [Alphaproteobacteria bacterium]|nr:hypothetical protein [Alphaproteobacteria bacterium]